MVAYFLLGGAYSMQLGDNVRMDLLYGVWSDRTKAAVDAVTICFLIFYLIVLLGGGISSTQYALQYNEVSPTLWRPQLAPIKLIMCIGIFLMLDRKSVVKGKSGAVCVDHGGCRIIK